MESKRSLDADWYLYFLQRCEDLDEMDALMDKAAEDPTLSSGDFIQLTMYCKGRIEAEGWLR